MLVLTRKPDEKVMIGEDIQLVVLSVTTKDETGKIKELRHCRVRLGIDAPSDVEVDREEIRIAKREGNVSS